MKIFRSRINLLKRLLEVQMLYGRFLSIVKMMVIDSKFWRKNRLHSYSRSVPHPISILPTRIRKRAATTQKAMPCKQQPTAKATTAPKLKVNPSTKTCIAAEHAAQKSNSVTAKSRRKLSNHRKDGNLRPQDAQYSTGWGSRELEQEEAVGNKTQPSYVSNVTG